MTSSYYLAITIGPVIKTLKKAKTTRELWVASFILSKLVEIIVKYETLNKDLISPQEVGKDTNGAGAYPDRVYWKLNTPYTESDITKFKSEILSELSIQTSNLLSVQELEKYLKMYWVQATWTDEELSEKPFLFRLNEILDGIELQEKWEQNNAIELLEKLIAKGMKTGLGRPVYKWRTESAQKDLFPYVTKEDNMDVLRFPSITEICTSALRTKDDKWYTQNIIDNISAKLSKLDEIENDPRIDDKEKKKQKDELDDSNLMSIIKKHYNKKDEIPKFLSRHKYIAIIQSDGDGVGTFLRDRVGNDIKSFKSFSEKLSLFSINSTKEVIRYGGVPVFAGGDDLLFFAPLKDIHEQETIIHLLQRLDNQFKELFPSTTMSQSFGMSVSYYKYPLFEAYDSAFLELVDKAKSEPGKNYVSVKLQKHSGHLIQFGYNLNSCAYVRFMKLLTCSVSSDENFLNSIMYKLDDQTPILEQIGHSFEKLQLFFQNNFNESKHKDYVDFFYELAFLIRDTFEYYSHVTNQEKIKRIYGSLRFIQFLNAKDKDDE